MHDARVLSSGGVPIAVHDLGGRGPTALVAHATSFNAAAYGPLARALGAALHCYAPDLRGHGASGAPADGDFAWDGLRDDVLATIAGLGLFRPYGIGHSSGATALLLAEARRPGTFAALYCYEPIVLAPGVGDRDRLAEQVAATRRRRDRFDSRAAAAERYAGSPLVALAPEVLAAYLEHGFAEVAGGVELLCKPGVEAAIYEASVTSDAWLRLGEVTCPVTVAYGAASGDLATECLPVLRDGLADVTVVEVPGLGHLGPLQDPGAVAESVLAALP